MASVSLRHFWVSYKVYWPLKLIQIKEDSLETKDTYSEAMHVFRHYSLAAMNLRVIVLAQGLVILSGTGLLMAKKEYLYSAASAVFGCIFTLSLLLFHKNLQQKLDSIVEIVLSLESSINDGQGFMTQYKPKHEAHSRGLYKELTVVSVFFILMFSAFIAVGSYAIYLWLNN